MINDLLDIKINELNANCKNKYDWEFCKWTLNDLRYNNEFDTISYRHYCSAHSSEYIMCESCRNILNKMDELAESTVLKRLNRSMPLILCDIYESLLKLSNKIDGSDS
jgi:hypothetical protein